MKLILVSVPVLLLGADSPHRPGYIVLFCTAKLPVPGASLHGTYFSFHHLLTFSLLLSLYKAPQEMSAVFAGSPACSPPFILCSTSLSSILFFSL